jgi:hypothetical protein
MIKKTKLNLTEDQILHILNMMDGYGMVITEDDQTMIENIKERYEAICKFIEVENEDIKPYYYGVRGGDESWCTEKCEIKNCMIGSVICKQCENCVAHGFYDHWIKCKVIDEATGRKQ